MGIGKPDLNVMFVCNPTVSEVLTKNLKPRSIDVFRFVDLR